MPIDYSPAFVSTSLLVLGACSYWYLTHKPSGSNEEEDKQPSATQVGAKGVTAQRSDVQGTMRITQIFVHPIKSCRGFSVPEARYGPTGLEGDRRWCIVDPAQHKVLTARHLPKMILITPTLHPDPSSSDGGFMRVSFPEESSIGSFEVPLVPTADVLEDWERVADVSLFAWNDVDAYLLPFDSPACVALSEYLGRPVQLALKGPRERICLPTKVAPTLGSKEWPADLVFQDNFPLLIASEESAHAVAQHVNQIATAGVVAEKWKDEKVPMKRFRPNLVFAGAGVPWVEDVLEEIVIDSTEASSESFTQPSISVVSKCPRCILPNIDPETGERDAAVPLKPLMQTRRNVSVDAPGGACFGSNGVPHGAGVVHVGDVVHVRKWLNN